MSSSDDLSRISGISNISRISKVNNSTLFKFDSTCNISEWRSCRDISKSFTADSQSKGQSEFTKVNKALAACDESTCDYAKLKFIHDCLEEIAKDESNAIKSETRKKLKDFITIHEVKKYLHLPNHNKDIREELTLLGIIDLPQYEFSYEEQLSIKSCLEAKLREKIHSFLTKYESNAGSTKEVVKNNESVNRLLFQQKLDILSWKDKIDEICIEHRKDLILCLNMLKRWHELQSEVHTRNLKTAETLLLQSEIAEMKAIITKLSCTIRMSKETPVTVDAFKILSSNLDEQIANVSDEIVEKTELKKAYDALNGTEYDEILKKYLETCHIINKKKNLLDKIDAEGI